VCQLGSLRLWDHRGKCYMDGSKENSMLVKASQHVPIYLQPFPVIQAVKSKGRNFSTFFAHFGFPWVRPWDYRGKCHMDRKRIQCFSNASQHIPIYLQQFLRYSDISVVSDGFWQFSRANERFFYHILLSPGYAPGKIAVNVTRLERGFNACKTPRCIYPSIFNRFWDIASYWWKIATFLYSTSV